MWCEALLSLWYGVSEEGKERDWRSPGLSTSSTGWSGSGMEKDDCRRTAPVLVSDDVDGVCTWNRLTSDTHRCSMLICMRLDEFQVSEDTILSC